MSNILAPDNPFIRIVGPIKDIDPATSLETLITTGTVTGFISASKDPAAITAHANLAANLVYVGNQVGRKVGQWMFRLPGDLLTIAILDAAFLAARPYLHVKRAAVAHVIEELIYSRTKFGTVVQS